MTLSDERAATAARTNQRTTIYPVKRTSMSN
jgi:hypothetical protein